MLNRHFARILSLVIIFFSLNSIIQAAPENNLPTKKRILIIYSANSRLNKSMREAFFKHIENNQIPDENRPEIYEESLDKTQLKPNPDFDIIFAEYLKQKYANVKLDLVTTFVAEATNFLDAHPELFPNVNRYVLSSNIYANSPADSYSNAQRQKMKQEEKQKVFGTILRLLPETERIIVVVAKEKEDHFSWGELDGLNLSKKIQVEVWNAFSFEELYRNVQQLPKNTVILCLHVSIDKLGQQERPGFVIKKLSEIASVPVFVHKDIGLNNTDAVGGFVSSDKQLGDLFGRKIMGEQLPETPEALQAELSGYYFNDKALKRWHIPDKNLPEGSIILNRPESIFYTYRWYIGATFLAFVLESILILWLTKSLQHGKKITRELADERNLLEVRVEQRTYELAERTEQLEESQMLFQDAAKVAKLGVFNYDLITNELRWNESMFTIYGIDFYQPCKSVYHLWRNVVLNEDVSKVKQAIQSAITENIEFDTRFRIQRYDGKIRTIQALGQVYRDENGKALRVIGINQDITEREEAEAIIHNLAYFDPLTQLPNRRMLAERLKQAIHDSHREKKKFAVMMMDLDKFKAVNDTLGHAAGDELLIQVAERIKAHLRENDTVARLGGDEFVVLLTNIQSPIDDTTRVANVLIKTLTQHFVLTQSDNVQIGTSIGIAFYPQHGEDGDALIDKADSALYAAKENGRGCFAYYNSFHSSETIEQFDTSLKIKGI